MKKKSSGGSLRLSRGQHIFNVFNIIFMLLLIFVTAYPIYYVVIASFSDGGLLQAHRGLLLYPLGGGTTYGYKLTLSNPNIGIGARNSVFYLLLGTTINVIATGLCSYVLSRKDFMLKKAITIMVMITMFFNGGMIPMFVIIRTLGMYDTIWALLLPGAISAYNMIIMRTFFQSIPESLEEAATIDGANDFVILFRIVMPLSMPIIAVMSLYYGVAHWNSWFNAMLYVRNRQLIPLQLVLREILLQNADGGKAASEQMTVELSLNTELIKYCVIVVSTVPILCVYPFLQRYFVKGVMIGAVKG